jgi:ferredoxin
VRIRLDADACQGHGRCYALAPDLFGCDDEGYAVVLATGELAADREADARLAADNCPEFAITVD